MLNSGRVELLATPRLEVQLCALERRTARGGRDSIDHPPGGHDDVANAVAGVLVDLIGRYESEWARQQREHREQMANNPMYAWEQERRRQQVVANLWSR